MKVLFYIRLKKRKLILFLRKINFLYLSTLKAQSFKNITIEKQKILQVYKKNSFFKRYECITQFILPFDVVPTEIVDEASFSP